MVFIGTLPSANRYPSLVTSSNISGAPQSLVASKPRTSEVNTPRVFLLVFQVFSPSLASRHLSMTARHFTSKTSQAGNLMNSYHTKKK